MTIVAACSATGFELGTEHEGMIAAELHHDGLGGQPKHANTGLEPMQQQLTTPLALNNRRIIGRVERMSKEWMPRSIPVAEQLKRA